MELSKKSFEKVRKLYYAIGIILFCAMLMCVVTEVIFRYVLNNPLTWIEELAQFIMIWVIFMGSVIAHWRGFHPSVDYFVLKFPVRIRQRIRIMTHIVVFALLMLVLGYSIMLINSLKTVRSAAMNIPWMYINAAVPTAMALMLPHQIRLIIRAFRTLSMENEGMIRKEKGS